MDTKRADVRTADDYGPALAAFCQALVMRLGVHEGLSIQDIVIDARSRIDDVERRHPGAWSVLEDGQPLAIAQFLNPVFAELNATDRQILGFLIAFTDFDVLGFDQDLEHLYDRRINFILDLLGTTYSLETVMEQMTSAYGALSDSASSVPASLLKNPTVVSVASVAVGYLTWSTIGFGDPGFGLVERGALRAASLLEHEGLDAARYELTSVLVLAILISEVGDVSGLRDVAHATVAAIQKLSTTTLDETGRGCLRMYAAVLTYLSDELSADDEYLPDDVPNLAGLRYSDAKEVCTALGIELTSSQDAGVWKASNWRVTTTTPEAGEALGKRRKVSCGLAR